MNFAAGTKRGVAGAGNGNAASYTGAVWTPTQLQSVITDCAPKVWINYTIRSGATVPSGGRFVPQFWDLAGAQYVGADPFNSTTIGVAVTEAGPNGWISFLNEPWQGTPGTNPGAVDPVVAAAAWDTLRTDSRVIANNIRLLSPATVDSAVPRTWMSTFLASITTRGPDAMALHKYSGDGTTTSIAACIADSKARFPDVPLWLTEFAVSAVGPSDATVQAFQASIGPILENEKALQYYLWFFAGPQSTTGLGSFNMSLYDDSAVVRAIGTTYKLMG